LDKSILPSVKTPTVSNIYVNVNTGNDGWDGTSATYTSGTVGPKKTINSGLGVSASGGNLNIASGTYNEHKLTVAKNLNIIGAASQNTIVDAGTNDLVFWIKSGYTVSISNLTLQNGKAGSSDFSGNGGAIYNEGTLTVNSCIMANNRARDGSGADGTSDAKSGSSGGAIYNKGTLTITNSDIHDNHSGKGGDASATHKSAHGGYGGAIYNAGTITLIQNTTFENNYCGNGGNSSAFHDGNIGGSGGAIYNSGIITLIQNTTFKTNYAGKGGSIQAGTAANGGNGGNGGAIFNTSTLSITGCTFDGNYAGSGADSSDINDAANGGHGGAIYNNTGTLTITGTTLKNNNAGKGGDCDDAIKIDVMDAGTGGNGGAIYNAATLTIQSSTLNKNKAGDGGDANAAGSNPGNAGNGGAIYNTNPVNVNITGTTISDNMAGLAGKWWVSKAPAGNGGHGGAIYNTGILTIGTSNIFGNRAGIAGYISKSSFAHGGSGGAIYNTGTLTVTNTILKKNHAGRNLQNKSYDGLGGAIYSNSPKAVTVNYCQIAENKTYAIYLAAASSTTMNLQNNWWGSNAEPKSEVIGTSTTATYYTPWIIMGVKANPTSINVYQTSTVTANLLMNSNGENTLQKYGKTVPDGISILFIAKLGMLKPRKAPTTSGAATTTFTASSTPGLAPVFAVLDKQKLTTTIKIGQVSLLNVKRTVNKSPIYVGDIFSITFKFENKGFDTAKNVVIKIPIPTAFEFINAQFDHGTWNYDESARTVIWNVGESKVGDHYLIMTLKALEKGHFLISHSITSSTYNPNSKKPIVPLDIYVLGSSSGNSATVSGKTVEMQETGAPIPFMVLAILMVIGGLTGFKRK
jgi:uncharacterized repeat protein (TIGR01451 family)